jgi:hypothetical protein
LAAKEAFLVGNLADAPVVVNDPFLRGDLSARAFKDPSLVGDLAADSVNFFSRRFGR